MDIIIVLGLLVVAILLFATEKLSVDIITFILLLLLIFTGILTPQEAFMGFSNKFIIILASIFVISGSLLETGVLDKIGESLVRLISKQRKLLLLYITVVPGIVSAFMNNTTVTALFIGPTIGIGKKLKVNPSKILMPLAFASILRGTCTLIGTSTNVAVSSAILELDLQPISLFEITAIGTILFGIGIVYMIFVGKFFLPEDKDASITENYNVKDYLSEIYITEGSSLIGQPAINSDLKKKNIKVFKVIRENFGFIPGASEKLKAGDLLLVQCTIEDLLKIKETAGIEIRADMISYNDLSQKDIQLAKVLITPQSSLIKKTLKETHFRLIHNVVVLAIHRFDQNLKTKIGDVCLQTGDLLLVQGSKESIKALRYATDFIVLRDFKPNLFREKKGYLTIAIFIAAIITGSLELLPLSVSFMTAGLLTILIGAITPERAYELIDWRLLVLIGSMSAFGIAMRKSGASLFLADWITYLFEPLGTMVILTAFVILVVILTQPMSNAAAALVVLPVAVETALQLGVNPRSFAIAVMLGASISLITPLEPSCILVYGPGKYKFKDFIRLGFPLTMILIAVIVFLVPIFWPLK
jgi:di/tricarboxylate transporter